MNRVTKEQAIRLKAVGYDVPTNENYFEGSDQSRYSQDGDYRNHNKIDITISAPYQDDVIDWFDTKEIFLEYRGVTSLEFGYSFRSVITQRSTADRWVWEFVAGIFRTRTEAKSAGVTKAIELLSNRGDIYSS